MRPGDVLGDVGSAEDQRLATGQYSGGCSVRNVLGEAEVDGIERYDQVFVVVDLLESVDHTWLATNGPGEVLVCDSVLQAHALLGDMWKLVLVNGAEVLAIKAEVAIRTDQPSDLDQGSSMGRS